MTPREPTAPARRIVLRQGFTVFAAMAAMAVAAWLLPASLHIVAWPRSGPHRLAVFAPLYRLWWISGLAVVSVSAVVIVSIGRPERLARLASVLAPLNVLWAWTIPYLPWLADRFPLLVALSGPLRWLFGAVAVGGVALRLLPTGFKWRSLPGRKTAFAVALVVYLSSGLYSLRTIGLGGDEPHYLVITHSLLVDHDLKIENNHVAGDYRAFFNGDLRPDYLQRGTNGEIYSIHAPGLSALLLPGYAVDGARGALVIVCLLAALAALAIFDIASMVAPRPAAWLAWCAVCLTVPFIPHAWSLYPEIAGAALVAWGLRWAMEERVASLPAWIFRGCCLAWLPWLHTKFSVFLLGLTAILLWRLRNRWRDAAALMAPIGLSTLAWLAFFKVIYGTFDPQAPYGGYTVQFVRLENVPRSLLGLLFDQKFGFLVYAPIYALIVPGILAVIRDVRSRAIVLGGLALAVAYGLSSARLYMWWGGSSAPARFLMPIVPLVAPFVAAAIARLRGATAQTTWTLLGVGSVLVGLAGAIGTGQLILFSAPHGVARMLELLQGNSPLTAAFPTFTQEDWVTPAWHLAPWIVAIVLAIAAGVGLARRGGDGLWIAAAELCVFCVAAAVLIPSVGVEGRAETRFRGEIDLLARFDPERARAYDYARMRRLSPQDWLDALTMTFDREPGSQPDEIGRLTEALSLPPGQYQARVWFEGDRPRGGVLQAAVGQGYQVGRVEEPLPNPAVLDLSLPVAVPALWVQLTDQSAARAVRRVEILARSIEPSGARSHDVPSVIDGFDDRPHAYVGYMDDDTYPERGMFWTRGTERGRLLLVPAGAMAVNVTVHVGPKPATVSLRVGDDTQELALGAEEARTVRVALPTSVSVVPIEVASTASFRPAEVDRRSSDRRDLGCQVRLVLE